MLTELHRLGVEVKPNANWDAEEWANHVLHKYNVHAMPEAYRTASETAAIVYSLRKGRNQVWNTPFRPGVRRG